MNIFVLIALALLLLALALRAVDAATMVIATCALLSLVIAGRGAAEAGLMVVHTPSVPVGLYWRSPFHGEALELGQYVCLVASSPASPSALREGVRAGVFPEAWRSEQLVKRVAARSGAVVSYDVNRGVLVGAEPLSKSLARKTDSQGRPLPSASYPVRVGDREVWLHSEHEEGFDSRYFGPVRLDALSCVAEPLWTW